MATNRAAWLDGKGKMLRIAPATMPEPAEGEVLIRSSAIAINPVDWKVQDLGILVESWPVVPGQDVAGTVVAVGSGVDRFKQGDRVLARLTSWHGQSEKHGGFQNFVVASAATTAILPDSIPFAQGATLPVALNTALVALFAPVGAGLGLQLPAKSPTPSEKDEYVVIWGGSSAIGLVATQLAVYSGVKVIATASEQNFEVCKLAGASQVFDHRSQTVVEEIISAVGRHVTGILDCVSDATSTVPKCIQILKNTSGGNLAVVLPQAIAAPENIKISMVSGRGGGELTHSYWQNHLTADLEAGRLRCLTKPLSAGKNLESLQTGLDMLRRGVSAQKVIVEI